MSRWNLISIYAFGETAPQNSVVIIDMNMPMQPLRRPITTDSTLTNPNTRILALKAQLPGTTVNLNPIPWSGWQRIHWIGDVGGCFRYLLLDSPGRCLHQSPISRRCRGKHGGCLSNAYNANKRTEHVSCAADWRLLFLLYENQQCVHCNCSQQQCQCNLYIQVCRWGCYVAKSHFGGVFDEDARFFMAVPPILVSWILENKEEMGDFPFFIKGMVLGNLESVSIVPSCMFPVYS